MSWLNSITTVKKWMLIVYVFFVNLWKIKICFQPSFLHNLSIIGIIDFLLCKIYMILFFLWMLKQKLNTVIGGWGNKMDFTVSWGDWAKHWASRCIIVWTLLCWLWLTNRILILKLTVFHRLNVVITRFTIA